MVYARGIHAISSLKSQWISIIAFGTIAQIKNIFFEVFTIIFIFILLKFEKADPILKTNIQEKGIQIYIRSKY